MFDQYVEAAERVDGFVHQPLAGVRISKVGLQRDPTATGPRAHGDRCFIGLGLRRAVVTATSAPARASSVATTAPIRLLPVTSATRPSSSIGDYHVTIAAMSGEEKSGDNVDHIVIPPRGRSNSNAGSDEADTRAGFRPDTPHRPRSSERDRHVAARERVPPMAGTVEDERR